MPEPPRTPDRRVQRALGWVGLAAASWLGLRPAVLVAAGEEELPEHDISGAHASFVQLQRNLLPGDRVGWLLPRGPPVDVGRLMLVSQYALLPRRLRNVVASDCAQAGRQVCGVDELDLALVPHWPMYSGSAEAMELGFHFDDDVAGQILVARPSR
jgi:hypothetical protein